MFKWTGHLNTQNVYDGKIVIIKILYNSEIKLFITVLIKQT